MFKVTETKNDTVFFAVLHEGQKNSGEFTTIYPSQKLLGLYDVVSSQEFVIEKGVKISYQHSVRNTNPSDYPAELPTEMFDVTILIKNEYSGTWEKAYYYHTDSILREIVGNGNTKMYRGIRGGFEHKSLWPDNYLKFNGLINDMRDTLYSALVKFGRDTGEPTDSPFQWLENGETFYYAFTEYLMHRKHMRNFSDIFAKHSQEMSLYGHTKK